MVTERVAPETTPDQAYALYVPSSYSPRSPAPILYLLDARGRAMLPLERFRPAAERLGWLLASSWTSVSDGPFQPNLDALRAMWRDTHEKLAVADGRAYAAGFSGTARAAVTLAMLAPGSLAGVISSGAGFPAGTDPEGDLPFAYFAAIGTRDFNYWEVLDLDEELD
ncbi:MAG: hypothetical protein R3234_08970, partial [Thermoanaerobaculia bacterium]|nr:hypothetical protein [Thermoanaerobaculia bacterium]